MPFQIKNGVLQKYTEEKGVTEVVIPNNVTSIGDRAFKDCKSLTRITIPDSVTSIGEYAFFGCESLTNITIPDSVTSIGNWTFWGCYSLTNITIPDSVTSIGKYAFYWCESLTNITIPDSVTSIGDWAFCGCKSLTSISIPKHLDDIKKNPDKYAWESSTEIIVRTKETAPPPSRPLSERELILAEYNKSQPKTTKKKKAPSHSAQKKPVSPSPSKIEIEMSYKLFLLSKDEQAEEYMKAHIVEYVKYLIDEQQKEQILSIFEQTDFITLQNIDNLLNYSIESVRKGGSFDIQALLTICKMKLQNPNN